LILVEILDWTLFRALVFVQMFGQCGGSHQRLLCFVTRLIRIVAFECRPTYKRGCANRSPWAEKSDTRATFDMELPRALFDLRSNHSTIRTILAGTILTSPPSVHLAGDTSRVRSPVIHSLALQPSPTIFAVFCATCL